MEQQMIQNLKTEVMAKAKEPNGCRCPVCSQRVKIYQRKLSSIMAKALVVFYKVDEQDDCSGWLHVHGDKRMFDATAGAGDYGKLRFWAYAEPEYTYKGTNRAKTGRWRITEEGKKFVRGLISAPKYVYVYNNRMVGKSDDERIRIDQALGEQFSLSEIMGYVPDKYMQEEIEFKE